MDDNVKRQYLQRLVDLKVTGKGVGHLREQNLKVIQRIKKGDKKATLGIDSIMDLEKAELLEAIAAITGCSTEISFVEGEGYINPEATLDGLMNSAEKIAQACRGKKNFLCATGHPGSMLGFYLEAIKTIKKLGGNVLTIPAGACVAAYKCPFCGTHDVEEILDCLSDIAVVTDGSTLLHTHATKPMEVIIDSLKAEGKSIDLVLADHGFAGKALTSGLDVIAVMDTNDPALAAARLVGYDLSIIPMDDNRPNYISKEVGKIFGQLICSFF